MKIWYEDAAENWIDGLPIGNGTIGAMIFGKAGNEIIQINEDSIWSGKKINRENKDAKKTLDTIRDLIHTKKIEEAEKLAVYGLSGTPNSQRAYQTAGEIYLKSWNQEEIEEYYRALDLDNGIVEISYKQGETQYKKEMFASYEFGVIVIHLSSNGPQKLSFDCHLERKHNSTNEVFANHNTIGFEADTGSDGILFRVMLRAVLNNGKLNNIGEHLIVQDAEEVTLFLHISTSFRSKNLISCCENALEIVEQQKYYDIKRNHMKDYKSLFGKMELSFDSNTNYDKYSTSHRLERIKEGEDDFGLLAIYFQFARYLMICSSRPGSLPANLQGIWNGELNPPWDSKYTININTQMNYWMAESCNLSECHIPLIEFINRIKESGKKTARDMYGCRGSVAHHNCDIYADTAPQDYYVPATYWVMGEAWLATHIWERYLYTLDEEFLENNFDVLQQSIEFFNDFLIENEEGYLVTSPSLSPENTYIMDNGIRGCLCNSATMDIQILNELYLAYIKACNILGKKENIEKAESIRKRFPPCKIGRYGQLQEWMEDYDELEPGHRHFSHLFGVYPGKTINQVETLELWKAANKSLERRLEYGGGHTGWSRAWTICLYAHFKNGEKVYENIKAQLSQNTANSLLDTCPMDEKNVFQIDGNFGTAAGILQMLVQCYENRLELLPALPSKLSKGMVKGICIYGNAQLEMEWEENRLIRFSIFPKQNQKLDIYYNNKKWNVILQKEERYFWNNKE